MNIWAILLAAGQGSRLAPYGGSLPKQFLDYQGKPLFWYSAQTLSRLPFLRGIVFVFPDRGQIPGIAAGEGREDCGNAEAENGTGAKNCPGVARFASLPTGEDMLRQLNAGGRLGLPVRVTQGGERRQDSVANGLAALPPECDAVLVHDSARPFASAALMSRVAAALAEGHTAVIPGIPVADTIKVIFDRNMVSHTLPRAELRAAQTPQGFSLGPFRVAHGRAKAEGWDVTDDAALMEQCGFSVLVVAGEESNRKITTPEDIGLLARAPAVSFLPAGAFPVDAVSGLVPCNGFGYDVHRYGGHRPFIIGGVPVSCDVRLSAHSDGDVLLHALMDALLGCVGGGDIGALFPDTDPAFAGIASGILLSEVLERTRRQGLRILHVDSTIIAQVPRIAPHREAIAANLAKLLEIPVSSVNVKATTEEGMGFTGEKKGLKAVALVSGMKPVLREVILAPA